MHYIIQPKILMRSALIASKRGFENLASNHSEIALFELATICLSFCRRFSILAMLTYLAWSFVILVSVLPILPSGFNFNVGRSPSNGLDFIAQTSNSPDSVRSFPFDGDEQSSHLCPTKPIPRGSALQVLLRLARVNSTSYGSIRWIFRWEVISPMCSGANTSEVSISHSNISIPNCAYCT